MVDVLRLYFGLYNAQCEISLQIFQSQKTCQMNWNSILEKTGLEILEYGTNYSQYEVFIKMIQKLGSSLTF